MPTSSNDGTRQRLVALFVVAFIAGTWLLLGPTAQPPCTVSVAEGVLCWDAGCRLGGSSPLWHGLECLPPPLLLQQMCCCCVDFELLA